MVCLSTSHSLSPVQEITKENVERCHLHNFLPQLLLDEMENKKRNALHLPQLSLRGRIQSKDIQQYKYKIIIDCRIL